MANWSAPSFCHILMIFIATISILCGAVDEDRKVHIVYMGALPEGEYSLSSQHLSILGEVLEDNSSATEYLVRSYKRSFNAFAAKLNDLERQKLAGLEGVVSVFPSRTLKLLTTRSWDFMGFSQGVKRNPKVESDVIVGVIDSGIWPESESFSDEGFGPVPKKWKGACKGGKNFTCNNKLIGARVYSASYDTARDMEGHGTHTSSTVAGNRVIDVGFYGLAQGNARGGVPSARIAAYKACNKRGCTDEDILAAFDDAIADGVDLISISVGGNHAVDFSYDVIAIGAFHAMQNGILTSNSAGNDGPRSKSVYSVAPWILSVAASSTDRRIIDKVILGDGMILVGNSVNSVKLNGTKHPLLYGKDISSKCGIYSAQQCSDGCLDGDLVKKKIVLCDTYSIGEEAVRAGALGAIMSDSIFYGDFSYVLPISGTLLSPKNVERVKSYMNSTKNPQAMILGSEAIKDSDAPAVVSFSSRGPNAITPEIIKPDITAPGVDILAAFSPVASPSGSYMDKRSVKYSILSGTSMSCPHTTGAAAYVKSFHPNWSPSAIKSALMTTAWPMNATKNPDGEFAYGAGHINPVKAVNPGLVYEALKGDYIEMLCKIGYDTKRVRLVTGDRSSCSNGTKGTAKDLNYPSMAAHVQKDKPFTSRFSRTVKNVGLVNSTYKAMVASFSKMNIAVQPSVLTFTSLNEKQSFVVTISGTGLHENSMASGSLQWTDGTHTVRSPIVVHTY